jgi:hypothetical protein
MTPRNALLLPIALLGLALLAPSAHAQGRGGRGFAGGGGARIGRRGFAGGAQRGYYPGWGFLPGPYYYPEDDSGYWPPAAPAYPAYPVAVAPPTPPAPPVEPLLMEDRDGQWVRIPTGSQLPTAAPAQTASAQPSSSSASPAIAAPPIVKLPSAVIVFRDGHTEEVNKYMIRGNVLYTSADYWTTGAWTRKILVADLDVPATLKVNQQRGAKFDLPSGPAEIMVRF